MPPFDLAQILDVPDLPAHLMQVEQTLQESVSSATASIQKPALRVISGKSKRLRPALIIAIAASQKQNITKTVVAACSALELVHIATLIHDDIIDQSNSRRGVPTINSIEGPDQAIVVGDYLFSRAIALAAQINSEAVRLVATIIAALCDGQSRELVDRNNTKRSEKSALKAMHDKTAMLFAAACELGGLCANSDQSTRQAFNTYGKALGMAFQCIDDVLDLVSAPELTGKPTAHDVLEGVYTLPVILALRGPHQATVERYLTSKQRLSKLTELLMQDGTIAETLRRAKQYNQQAQKAIGAIDRDRSMMSLAKLPDHYLQWAMQHLVAEGYRTRLAKAIS
ncbi:MAG TPA: polyprenyl synthetase family protein [Candidatus Saccharimonadales bacterium]|nr:polyprenyl synthetase family protein [Candidatus Saccharimonadales bacterium]